jgi:4-hydroxy-2-oxoglutarate aldolase
MSPSAISPSEQSSNGFSNGSSRHRTNGHNGASHHDRPLIPGVYVPTVAFFDDNEDVDIFSTEKHAARLATTGIAGIVTHGSNGEAVHLDREERILITRATRRALDSAGQDDMPIIVGCGAQSTRETIRLCREAASSGGDYALVLPPSYYGSLLTSDLLLSHFRAVADASPVPLLIYNFPAVAGGLDIISDQIIALSKHPNIVGVKLTCGNTGKLCRVAAGVKGPFLTTGGSADFILPTLIVGGDGVIAGLANLAPKSCVRIMELYKRGELAQAQELQAIVARGDWVAIKGGFVAVKSALRLYEGCGSGLPRSPCVAPGKAGLIALSEQFREVMELERSL